MASNHYCIEILHRKSLPYLYPCCPALYPPSPARSLTHAHTRARQLNPCGPIYLTLGDGGNIEGPYRRGVEEKIDPTGVKYAAAAAAAAAPAVGIAMPSTDAGGCTVAAGLIRVISVEDATSHSLSLAHRHPLTLTRS